MPEFDVKATAKQILEKDTRDDKVAGAIANLRGISGWVEGLKPFIEARIERLKGMAEVDLDGKESLAEIGLKYVLCSAVASELADILMMVEENSRIVDEKKAKKKKTKK